MRPAGRSASGWLAYVLRFGRTAAGPADTAALPFSSFGRAGTRFADNGLVSKVQLSRIPGVRNVWKVAIPALLVLEMAGCETVSRSPAPLTTVVVPEPFA